MAQAEKAFPGLRPARTTGFPNNGGVICDTILESGDSQSGSASDQKPKVRLCFYAGKFIAMSRTTGSVGIPRETNTSDLDKELQQRVLGAMGPDTFEVFAYLAGGRGSMNELSDAIYEIAVWHKALARAALEERRQKSDRQRSLLVDDLTRTLLEQ